MADDKTYNVLFLCTGNSARSVIAEAVLNRIGTPKFTAYSAGSHPKGTVNPRVADLLRTLNYPVDTYRSKSWDEFAQAGAPKMDFVITLCDSAAGEMCPIWPGQPMTAHWPFEDPATQTGTEAEIASAVAQIYGQIERRMQIFVSLPVASLDRMSIQKRLDEMGRTLPEAG